MKSIKTNFLKFKINKINMSEKVILHAKIIIWIRYLKTIKINQINLSQQYRALN